MPLHSRRFIDGSALLVWFGLVIQTAATNAAAVAVPDDMALIVDKPIRQIAAHYGLNEQQASLARTAAAGFAFVGMCRGVGFPDAMGAIQVVMGADPDVPYQAATLAMLGIYTRIAFGRQNSAACAKAHDDAERR